VWRTLSGSIEVATTMRRLVQSPGRTLTFFKHAFVPTKGNRPDEKGIDRFVEQLDHSNYRTRDLAFHRLQRLGERAEPALKRGLTKNVSIEGRRRIQELLDAKTILQISAEDLQAIRGIEVIERIGTAEAREFLTSLSKGEPLDRATRDAASALSRLKGK
jgi:hypothetical protein